MKNALLILLLGFSFITCSKNDNTPAMVAPVTSSLSIDTITAIKIATGSFTGAGSYSVSGRVTWFKNTNKQILYLNNFSASSGPDLKVYLSKDIAASSFINLGNLKGLTGNQEYDIPASANLSEYKFVLIWFQRFSANFGTSNIK
jgi:hypothetical protein